MGLIEKIHLFVDSFVPAELLEGADSSELFRARIISAISIAAALMAILFSTGILGIPEEKLPALYAGAIGNFSILIIMKFSKISFYQISNLLTINTMIPISLSIYSDGVYNSPIFMWYSVIPVVALFSCGLKRGFTFTIIASGLNVGLFLNAQKYGLGYPEFWNEKEFIWQTLSNQLACIWVVFCGTSLFELVRVKNEKDLEKQQQVILSQQDSINRTKGLAVISQISSGVSHEVNTPLMIIQSSSLIIKILLRQEKIDHEKALIMAGKIEKSTERIANIVHDFRKFSDKVRVSDPKEFTIEELLISVENRLSKTFSKSGIHFEVRKKDSISVIFGERNSIFNVLIELLENSIDSVKNAQVKTIELVASQLEGSSKIKFTVTDSGMGINKENEELVFTPFFSTKEVGAGKGLGLSVCHGVVRDHDGEIYIDRSVEAGFAISFTLSGRKKNLKLSKSA